MKTEGSERAMERVKGFRSHKSPSNIQGQRSKSFYLSGNE